MFVIDLSLSFMEVIYCCLRIVVDHHIFIIPINFMFSNKNLPTVT